MPDSGIYNNGEYKSKNPTWHTEDAPGKAADLLASIQAAIAGESHPTILEVGCGTGGVLASLRGAIGAGPSYVGIDVAAEPVEQGVRSHPGITLRVQDFLDFHDHVRVVIFSDVLEHLENPTQFMRHARAIADCLVVRQPLQGDLGVFRTNGYGAAIEDLGHIQFFSSRSFIALAGMAGWKEEHLQLVAPWDLKTQRAAKPPLPKRLLARWHPDYASMLTSGFYLVGSFR